MYINTINNELKKYLLLLCDNDYPDFIEKYIQTKELQRLSGIGQFCGADYTNFYNLRFWYTRLDHSVACALMTWHFTKSKMQTLSALFHDLGTPAFSHCIDFLMGDGVNQESSELNVLEILSQSEEIKNLLEEDSITDINLLDDHNYSIIENKKPKICVDRLDGVLHTCYIWLQYWDLATTEKVYRNIAVLMDEEGNNEIGFLNKEVADLFFDGVFQYSIELQTNKNKYMMNFFSKLFSDLIQKRILNIDNFYNMSEADILTLVENSNNPNWNLFKITKEVISSNEIPNSTLYFSGSSKKRYVIPLCKENQAIVRLNEISTHCQELLDQYLNYEEETYYYVRGINFN